MLRKPQLFGTDGVRGVAGRFPLDSETVGKLGRALGLILMRENSSSRPEVLLGEDTRESSPWIALRLAGGLRASGVDVAHAGVITTPGAAFLTRHHGFAAGVMISASHNPFGDNGIKVLSSAGTKLPESLELEIEETLENLPDSEISEPDLKSSPALLDEYLKFLESLVPASNHLSRFRFVVDCANGASSAVAPEFLRRLGVQTRILNAEPDGRNINRECGSLYPRQMAAETQSFQADLGVAFDGDADRAIFATRAARVLDGDYVIFAMAPFLQSQNALKGGAVVGTLMTNLGLELALKKRAIGVKRTPVGDKFVLEEMLRSGINLGGEPSGHIIFSDVSIAGDGMVTFLEMLRLLSETGASADELMKGYRPFPQLIRNVRVKEKPALESVPEVAEALAHCRAELGDQGRVVLRYSGTEPLARVMVEGEDAATVEHHTAEIATAIERTIGAAA
ncbi:MAG TPA: phosphoglucosamine mutase [Terriglobia bacterium]|nr:phosphoglucosamine mutase [Terriglobia bacterium]